MAVKVALLTFLNCTQNLDLNHHITEFKLTRDLKETYQSTSQGEVDVLNKCRRLLQEQGVKVANGVAKDLA